MVAVRKEIAEARPDIVREIFRLLQESRRLGDNRPTLDGIDLQPIGFEAVRPAVEMIVRFAFEQKLIPENYPVEALFGPVLEAIA
jgi:4,5-dihydroxyphthalate decarboxylase